MTSFGLIHLVGMVIAALAGYFLRGQSLGTPPASSTSSTSTATDATKMFLIQAEEEIRRAIRTRVADMLRPHPDPKDDPPQKLG